MSADNTRRKKGPTPTRKEQEAKNFQGLLGKDKKLAKERARAESRRRIEREQEGMRTGREDLLPPQHQGQARRMTRNFVDQRYAFSEWMILIILVLMFGSLIVVSLLTKSNPHLAQQINTITMLLSYAVLIGGCLEAGVIAGQSRKLVIQRLGREKVPRGIRWYAFARAVVPRRWRNPRPQVPRSNKTDSSAK